MAWDTARFWWPSAAAVIVVITYVPFFKALVNESARNPYAGHATFVPILAVVLLWAERHRLRGLTAGGHAGGAALTGLALALVGIGYRAASVPLQALSFVVAIAGLLLWCHGIRGVRKAGFVLAFLLFAVPPPRDVVAAIGPGIQHFVAAFSSVVLESLRIPVDQQGVFLRLPGLTLEVAEECNGLRFLLVLLVFAAAFARVVVPTISGQLVLMILAVPVAVLANAIRVAVTAVGGYAIGPHVATGPIHYYVGKSLWALAILVMIAIAWVLRSRIHGTPARGDARPSPWVAGIP